MDLRNATTITTIQLLGFQIPQRIKWLVFILLLVVYCVTICGNLLIITLVSSSRSLHSPMYFFLSQLSVSDLLQISDTLPTTISTVLLPKTFLSISYCIAQFYFFALVAVLECLLLTVMSWDRYLAICKPLHYTMKMNSPVCWTLIIISWVIGLLAAASNFLPISKSYFCGPNIIDHFFCDFDPILRLSCSDISFYKLVVMILGIFFCVFPFFIILASYFKIIITIVKISSIIGRQKAFSTCSSHLTVVSLYYGTLVCVYMVPNSGQTQTTSKLLSLLFTVVTPMMNPIIYSLRNKELKNALEKLFNNCMGLCFSTYYRDPKLKIIFFKTFTV